MSFLDPQGAHPSLLHDGGADEWDVLDALEVLVAFSLIRTNESDGTYSMHRLVQIATLPWLASTDAGDRDKCRPCARLANDFPTALSEIL